MNTNHVTDGELAQLTAMQDELFQRAKNDAYNPFDEMLDGLRKVIDGKTLTTPIIDAVVTTEIFCLAVDYSLSLNQMITAGGYDWVNDDITAKRFPIEGNGIVLYEARYFHFNRNSSSENAAKPIERVGWWPARIEHLLSHGATFPEEQRKFPIVGIGSVAGVDGCSDVPFLAGGRVGRRLDLSWFDDIWNDRCRFLAVREVSGSET